MPKPKFEMKSVKTFKGHEGMQGFEGVLYIDGKKACEIFDDCRGGEFEYRWFDRNLEKVLDDHIKTLPQIPPDPERGLNDPMDMSRDIFIDEMVNAIQNAKEFKKFQKRLSFKLPDDGYGQYRTAKCLPTPDMKAHFKKKYPEAVFLDEHPNDFMKIINRTKPSPK